MPLFCGRMPLNFGSCLFTNLKRYLTGTAKESLEEGENFEL
jgi:hypothetical protein